MPLYLVRRAVPGASAADIDAAGYRAVACTFVYEGLRWRSSYWDRAAGELTCIYEAESVEQIREHSRQARIPCDDVTLVEEVNPEEYGAPRPDPAPPREVRWGHTVAPGA